jgi:hypothetical protein
MQLLHAELLDDDPNARPDGLSRWAIRVWRLVAAELWLRAREDSGALEQLESGVDLPMIEPRFESSQAG